MLTARYYDGIHAASAYVKLFIYSSGLGIAGEHVQATWNFEDIRPATNPADGLPIRLRNEKHPQARLEIHDATTWETVGGLLKDRARLGFHIAFNLPALAAMAGLGLLILLGLYRELPHMTHMLAPYLPRQARVYMAQETLKFLNVKGKECHTSEGDKALRQLQDKLVDPLHLQENIRIRVVPQTTPNAFALPDGSIIVFSGLIEQASSPDELAGVLAHEMGHIVKNHPAEGVVESLGLQAVLMLMTGKSSESIDSGRLAQWMLQTHYQRDKEREADREALNILAAAHISPRGLQQFFERLQSKGDLGGKLPTYFSTHPPHEERIATLSNAAMKLENEKYPPALEKPYWSALRDICSLTHNKHL